MNLYSGEDNPYVFREVSETEKNSWKPFNELIEDGENHIEYGVARSSFGFTTASGRLTVRDDILKIVLENGEIIELEQDAIRKLGYSHGYLDFYPYGSRKLTFWISNVPKERAMEIEVAKTLVWANGYGKEGRTVAMKRAIEYVFSRDYIGTVIVNGLFAMCCGGSPFFMVFPFSIAIWICIWLVLPIISVLLLRRGNSKGFYLMIGFCLLMWTLSFIPALLSKNAFDYELMITFTAWGTICHIPPILFYMYRLSLIRKMQRTFEITP